jgi:hypothetical protein
LKIQADVPIPITTRQSPETRSIAWKSSLKLVNCTVGSSCDATEVAKEELDGGDDFDAAIVDMGFEVEQVELEMWLKFNHV